MIVKHFEFDTPTRQSPFDNGWKQGWYGYYYLAKCWSEQRNAKFAEEAKSISKAGEMDERQFEIDCFLSVLADINKKHVNMFELGAGWGDWSLALAGVVDFKIVPIIPTSYRCLAVEGEPTHYQWIKEHFARQNINGTAVHGAVSSKNGSCHFILDSAPDSCYGQAMVSSSGLTIKKIAWYLYNYVFRRTAEISTYTIDHLLQAYNFEHVDIINIDVQGAEYEVMLGAAKSIKDDLIDYLIIGTHQRKFNDSLRHLLSPTFDLVVDIYPNSVGKVEGFCPIRCRDGVQLYKRKNL